MGDRLRPVHGSIVGRPLHRINGMTRLPMESDTREFIEGMALSIFTDMSNCGHGFQAALAAIYLSGLNHGATTK